MPAKAKTPAASLGSQHGAASHDRPRPRLRPRAGATGCGGGSSGSPETVPKVSVACMQPPACAHAG
eukprot:20316-Chlamydomonas_euryale.AAC.3